VLAFCLAGPLGIVMRSAHAQDRAFAFALIGDMPYSKAEEKEFANLVAALNNANLAFVVHVGDMQQDARRYDPTTTTMPCNDDYDKWMLGMFQGIRHPVIVTPGDNDWTDCHYLSTSRVDPLERLAKVRSAFFPGGKSLGQSPIAVESQANDQQYAKFVENLRFSMDGVMFATLHIVGSNDNCCRTLQMDSEHHERKAANIAWMKAAFTKAKAEQSRGLVLMTQANPFFENHWPERSKSIYLTMIPGTKGPERTQPTVFDDYIATLREEMESYDKPVAYLHGDTHRSRAIQRQDQQALRELHAGGNIRLAGYSLGEGNGRSSGPRAVPLRCSDRLRQHRQSSPKMRRQGKARGISQR
jgi:hypothetical protein